MIQKLSPGQADKLRDWLMHIFTWNDTLEGTEFWNWLYSSIKPGEMFPTHFVTPKHVRDREGDTLWTSVDLTRLDAFRRYVYTSTTSSPGIMYLLRRLDIIREEHVENLNRGRHSQWDPIQTPNGVPPVRRSASSTPTSPRAVRRRLLLI